MMQSPPPGPSSKNLSGVVICQVLDAGAMRSNIAGQHSWKGSFYDDPFGVDNNAFFRIRA